jgi:hypothetical protein
MEHSRGMKLDISIEAVEALLTADFKQSVFSNFDLVPICVSDRTPNKLTQMTPSFFEVGI